MRRSGLTVNTDGVRPPMVILAAAVVLFVVVAVVVRGRRETKPALGPVGVKRCRSIM